MNNIQISKNFKLSEFQCKDGSQLVKLDSKLLNLIQTLRDKIGKPIIITSGYRTVAYNTKVGGIKNSLHTQGKAADITKRNLGMTDAALIKLCQEIGFGGVIIYDTFIHVDTGKKLFLDKRTKK